MKKIGTLLLAILLTGAVFMSGTIKAEEGGKDVTLSLRGVRVVSKPVGKDFGDQLISFYSNQGTAIAFLVTCKDKSIIDINQDKSKITKMTDDKGTDLNQKIKDVWSEPGFNNNTRFSKDKKAALVEVETPCYPMKGATSIALEGTLVLTTASKTKSSTSDAGKFEVGSTFKAGSLELEVVGLKKAEWGDYGFTVEIKGKDEFRHLSAFKILDENGKDVEFEDSGSSWGRGTVTRYFNIGKKGEALKPVKIMIEEWTDRGEIEVTIKENVSLGVEE